MGNARLRSQFLKTFLLTSASLALASVCLASSSALAVPAPPPLENQSDLSAADMVRNEEKFAYFTQAALFSVSPNPMGNTFTLPQGQNIAKQLIAIKPGWQAQFNLGTHGGVVSVGPLLEVGLITSATFGATVSAKLPYYSGVVDARYALRLVDRQILVPYAGGSYGLLKTRAPGNVASATISSVSLGAYLLMDFMEPSAARAMKRDNGIHHVYLVGELRRSTLSKTVLVQSGSALFFGLRFEY